MDESYCAAINRKCVIDVTEAKGRKKINMKKRKKKSRKGNMKFKMSDLN